MSLGPWTARPALAGPGPSPSTAGSPAPGGDNPTGRPGLRRLLVYGLLVTLSTLCASVLAIVLGADLGLQLATFAALLAALPLLVVVPTFLWLDRLEAEPPRYVVFAFLWGALGAAVGALALNTTASLVLSLQGADHQDALSAVLVAPPVEEALKGVAVLAILLFRRREFDGVVDGVVYAGLAGAGFAFSENIFYLGHAYQADGSEALTAVFFARCIMAPFAHPLFTACVGLGLGLAVATARTPTGRLGFAVGGFVCAVLLHGVWNASAVFDAYLTVYFVVQVPIFLGFVVLLVVLRHRETMTIRRVLSQYADAGWFTHAEVTMLASASGRRAARQWAAGRGPRARAAMRGFQDAASDLALLRARMARGVAVVDAHPLERRLLDAVTTHRHTFAGSAGALGSAQADP